MLYDNALLARAYLHGWQALGHERYRRVCEETLDWALREMRGPEGGFYSALDADSEGEEGRFYVWTPEEIREALAAAGLEASADAVIEHYGVTEGGNFEGAQRPPPRRRRRGDSQPAGELDRIDAARRCCDARARARLARPRRQAAHRLERADDRRPGRGGRRAGARGLPRGRARPARTSCWSELRDGDGRLLRTCKDGRGRLNAYLEDHAFLLEALLGALRSDLRAALVRARPRASPTR